MNKKIVSIEAMRFIFMLMICLWHYQGATGIFSHGYLGVEFFFILSGILIYHSASKSSPIEPLGYTIKKIKRFFPKYFCSIIIAFLIFEIIPIITHGKSIGMHTLIGWLNFIPECFMLHDIGIFERWGGYNYPLWYINVLVWGGGWLYACIYFYRKPVINIILPPLVVCGYVYLFNLSDRNLIEQWGTALFIQKDMIRGVCDMGLGIMIAYLYEQKMQFFISHKHLTDILSVLSFILAIAICVSKYDLDSYCLIFFSISFIGCLQEKSLFCKIFKALYWQNLGNITYSMLLLHAPIIYVFHSLRGMIGKSDDMIEIPIYVFVVVICSFVYDYCFAMICKTKKNAK